MKCRQEDLVVAGRRLKRYVFTPDQPGRIRAAAFHFHGQGDFSERYDETLEIFTRQGVACVATDLPGHGRSEGKRGDVPGFHLVDAVARANQSLCRELCPAARGPLGILGHSAGGLMALRELLHRPEPYSFAWISAPLLRPEANQNPLLVAAAPLVARLFPRLRVSTGVTGDELVHEGAALERALMEEGSLFHSRVSIGWGYEMMVAAREVRELLVSRPPAIPLLITQGGADPVCPPRFLHEALARTAIPGLLLHEFPEALHEPFADTGKEAVFAHIEEWLEDALLRAKPTPSQTSPSG